MKKIFIFFVVTAIFIFAFLYYRKVREITEEKEKAAREKIQPVSVSVVPVRTGEIEQYIYVTGTIRAVDREYCYFETGGKVNFVKQVKDSETGLERDIKEGDRVQKGELLAAVDASSIEEEINVQKALLLEANAALDKANADYQRYKTLFEKQTISKTEFEQYELAKIKAEMTVNACKARLKQAEVPLEHAKIYAPCDGIVAYMNVRKGYYFAGAGAIQNINTESELLKSIPFIILRDSEMEMTCEIPAGYADQIKPGLDSILFYTTIKNSEEKTTQIPAKVYSVNPAVDPGGRTVQVKIRTDKGKDIFRDGQYVSGIIITEKADNALIIPYSTLMFQDNEAFCFVIKDSVARMKKLRTGIEGLKEIQVIEGLEANDIVVAEGNFRLVDGTPVKIEKTFQTNN